MADVEITEKAVQEKLDKGETLTKEESAFVMSTPPDGVPEPVDTEPEKEPGEEIDIDAAPGEKKGKETAEAKIEKKADTEAKAKSSETPPPVVEPKPDEGTLHSKVESELAKPEGTEDLAGFTEREKGLFYEMRKSRKRAQKAEEDRDALMFEKIKAAKLAQERKPEVPAAEPEEDLFGKDVDPEDFPTIGKLKEISKKMAEKEGEAARARERTLTVRVSEMNARQVVEIRKENGKDAPDYDEVLELAPVIIEGNPDYEKAIYEAYVKGRNAALLTYDLIRRDPRFNSLYKPTSAPVETKPDVSDAGKKTLDKINANEAKPKTSGAGGAGGGGGGDEYTVDQLLRMTPAQFRKVPKQVRDKFLYNA